jgi:hypothetical protein
LNLAIHPPPQHDLSYANGVGTGHPSIHWHCRLLDRVPNWLQKFKNCES